VLLHRRRQEMVRAARRALAARNAADGAQAGGGGGGDAAEEEDAAGRGAGSCVVCYERPCEVAYGGEDRWGVGRLGSGCVVRVVGA
jgi:hypothetical protein